MDNLPTSNSKEQDSRKKGILHRLKKLSPWVLLVTGVVVVVIVMYIGVIKRSSGPISIPLFQKKASIELKTDYKNPFEKETQYVNPFEQYKNPFVLAQ